MDWSTCNRGGVRHGPQRFLGKTLYVPHFNHDTVEFASRERDGSKLGINQNKKRTATAQWEFHRSYGRRNKPQSCLYVYTIIEVSAVYQFCYKPNLTVLKSCMMLSRSSIMVLCFGRDLFPRVSLHEDLHTNSTHCMQIILKTRFQFPHWVMKKCFASKGYPNIQTYLPFLV